MSRGKREKRWNGYRKELDRIEHEIARMHHSVPPMRGPMAPIGPDEYDYREDDDE